MDLQFSLCSCIIPFPKSTFFNSYGGEKKVRLETQEEMMIACELNTTATNLEFDCLDAWDTLFHPFRSFGFLGVNVIVFLLFDMGITILMSYLLVVF